MVRGSQNAACFSNRREFILRVFSRGFVSGPFFVDSVKSCDKLFVYYFLCARLPSLCFTCVSGLESNFSRHHLDLMKVSTFCTTIVWPVYQSRSEAWIPYFPSSCEWNRFQWRISIFANGDQYVGFPRPGTLLPTPPPTGTKAQESWRRSTSCQPSASIIIYAVMAQNTSYKYE